ncbi:MAG: fumarylacetoacetate hydrolase family protein [Sinobacteraceae bacterium]|nr:fumarylacetoacetate hydrolase family protein [Nevskiaceae bacterium]MBV9912561.1 fumarylacetoacetate hydrolase family protein [Nevskiaceae bacterium]
MTLWARFRTREGREGFGQLTEGEIHEHAGDLFTTAEPTRMQVALHDVTLLAPCRPTKIIALWNNFYALAAKLGKAIPAHPLFLLKPASSVIGPDEPIHRPRSYQGKVAYEGELGIVIGRQCKDLTVEQAHAAIFGYTCVNDVTAAQVLNENADFTQWCRAKGYDTFGAIGPVISSDVDVSSAHVTTRLDGVERQNYPLSDMICPPEQLVSCLSQDMTLYPGDVIACGTSLGVGSVPDGSTVEVSIEGIGTLRNRLGAQQGAPDS